ncbi:sigma-70 family RNA polymerase sigma factor [Acetivibrio cellulolyticus]|uniref:sigma-70 family RNA polymerase sigma factor n=1 Tax=Acetivibrio cellulolyticus TaxID=35830 RepID=UPI0001E2E7E0|nr:sigma-70 family RNA polymerase sigma factor [Acetivibrio cellulolyticus]
MVIVNTEKVIEAIKGDKNAFVELIEERKADIFRLSYVYLKDNNDSLDLVSETVSKAYSSIKKLNTPEFFNTWITKITMNCCLNFLKKKKRISENELQLMESEQIYQLADDGEDILDTLELNIDLQEAIDRLDFNLKTIIILKYFQDFTINQISEILSSPSGTVKSHLNKALGILRRELANLKAVVKE